MTEIYQALEKKLADKTWTDTLSEEDTKLFTDTRDVIDNLISQVYIFIDYFHQYVDAIQAAAIFSQEYLEEKESDDAKVYPTQTSSAPAGPTPANRAARRAVKAKPL